MTGAAHRHAFVVPAYGESPYLRECLASLASQTRKTAIAVSTSTPSRGIESAAVDFGARLVVHDAGGGIGRDWNAALSVADAEWVTLAHQDDVYLPGFAEKTMARVEGAGGGVLVMTDYMELVGGRVRRFTPMLVVKRLLQEFAFLGRTSIDGAARMRLLRWGCSIPCPSVTIRRGGLGQSFYREDLSVNLDWDAWWRLAQAPGTFLRVAEPLMLHRIHATSETSAGVRTGVRAAEDLMMFRRMWPGPVAGFLAKIYALSYEGG